jgi:hypothetical protein
MKALMAAPTAMLVAGLAAAELGAGTVTARAEEITLDVSGILYAQTTPPASCSASGCTLGGHIVINNTTGAIVSAHVTLAGETPVVGKFTNASSKEDFGLFREGSLTLLEIANSTPPNITYILGLYFVSPTPGSLVGYIGGPLISEFVIDEVLNSQFVGNILFDSQLSPGSLRCDRSAIPRNVIQWC